MIVRTLSEVVGTDRDVRAPTFHSRRLLLASDGTEFSLHDTTLHAGSVTTMWYRNHVEAVYCVEGSGRLVDLTNDQEWDVAPGLLYTLDGHERHELRAETDLRMICVFTPPLVGLEVHAPDGSYPLLANRQANDETDGRAGAEPGALPPPSPLDRYPSRCSPTPTTTARLEPVVYGSAGDGPLSAGQIDDFDRDGFIQLASAFSADEADAFSAEMVELGRRDDLRRSGHTVFEPGSDSVRSVFEIHRSSPLFARLAADPRLRAVARQILGSEVYLHQSRVNYKPAFGGNGFDWHSDFETWHTEDGLPGMRTVSFSVALTPNRADNGPLMIMPGSHKWFVSCVGETPVGNFRRSLRKQEIGVPDQASLTELAERGGLRHFEGEPGSVTIFDCNCMHGSANNLSPWPRSNVFLVYNSVENAPVEPFAAPARRPTFVAAREVVPL